MKLVRIIVSGKVQGVFYRAFVKRESQKLGINGYVKNLMDGTVEIMAQGSEDSIKKLFAACKKGPLMAFVENVEIMDRPASSEFQSFDIRP